MKIYTNTKGPGLHVNVLFSGEKLTSVVLELREHPIGMAWAVTSPFEQQERMICDWMEQYCLGKLFPTEFPFDFASVTPWTVWVLKELEQIPFGRSLAYREVAEKMGRPRAARAVGSACGRNPFPLFIGCHRVLSSNSSSPLGGFSCGLEVKRRLLRHEGISF